MTEILKVKEWLGVKNLKIEIDEYLNNIKWDESPAEIQLEVVSKFVQTESGGGIQFSLQPVRSIDKPQSK
jgi:hypothetical protein